MFDRVTRSLVFCVMFYFSGVRVTRSLVLCVMFYFSGVRVTRSLAVCVMFYFSDSLGNFVFEMCDIIVIFMFTTL